MRLKLIIKIARFNLKKFTWASIYIVDFQEIMNRAADNESRAGEILRSGEGEGFLPSSTGLPASLTELDLIKNAQSGEAEALSTLLGTHAHLVVAAARRRGRTAAEIQQLIEGGMRSLASAISDFEPDFENYLKNKIDYDMTNQGRREVSGRFIVERTDHFLCGGNPYRHLHSQDFREFMVRDFTYLKGIGESYGGIVQLRFGLSGHPALNLQEISRLYGISQDKAETRFSRAVLCVIPLCLAQFRFEISSASLGDIVDRRPDIVAYLTPLERDVLACKIMGNQIDQLPESRLPQLADEVALKSEPLVNTKQLEKKIYHKLNLLHTFVDLIDD